MEDRCPERGKDIAEAPEQAREEHRAPAPGVSSHLTSGFSSPSGPSSRFHPPRSHWLSSGLPSAHRGRPGGREGAPTSTVAPLQSVAWPERSLLSTSEGARPPAEAPGVGVDRTGGGMGGRQAMRKKNLSVERNLKR